MEADLKQLQEFGTVLTLEQEAAKLPRAHEVDDVIASVMSILKGEPPRAVVLTGESGTGKTAVLHELVHRLRVDRAGGWHVLRMSPQEFLAETRYIGEWETKVRNIVNACKSPRRAVLYIPNIAELAWMGMWAKSDASVATALAPHIERGEIVIVGESTVEGFRKGLGANRSLRRLFHTIELPEADDEQKRRILQTVSMESGFELSDVMIERIVELADFCSTGLVEPGRSVSLLRRVLGGKSGVGGSITEEDLLKTVSVSTGVPIEFLDDNIVLDRDEVRDFFESRVMGQPEAVDAILDLVTLIKAGLNDPGKPYGVLLFVGPTGVGKTELARALAEHLFGDPDRLIRLDMSEYATYEAFERLIGSHFRASEPGQLTSAVREHPFSVVLLDEIEKGHPNIYNLCLQIFDAGRLTDAQGHLADFRRTIIVLTSNIGSSISTEGYVGFGKRAADAPSRELVLRELGRWFRPEFLNRLDRVVTFRPLPEEIAERIARRELARVMERSGITRRRLAVDVDPDVLPLLLREGYSPAFGARPLKRTVERMVLLPVARAIADGRTPAGSLLRLIARGSRIDVEVDRPEAEGTVERPAAKAAPVAERAEALLQQVLTVREEARPLAARKSELLTISSSPDFWDDRIESRRVLDEVYRLDGVLAAIDGLEKKVRSEVERAQRHKHSDHNLARVEERLEGLTSQASQCGFLVRCRESEQLGDAFVCLQLVSAQSGGLGSVEILARMYKAFAHRRGLEVDVIDDRRGGEPHEDSVVLMISGAGAYALLATETGLHQCTRGEKKDESGKKRSKQRDVVRVEVFPAPLTIDPFPPDDVRAEVRKLSGQRGRFDAHPKFDVTLFHVPTMTSVRAWTVGNKKEAVQRVLPVLRARVKATEASSDSSPGVVRRYRFGPTTLVRDSRTGRNTGRLDQVLDGHLDIFVTPDA